MSQESKAARAKHKQTASKSRIVSTAPYDDAAGNLVYEVVRYEPKTFRTRRPNPAATCEADEWIWDMDGVERVLYRLPLLLKAKAANEVIFLCEGEKDVDNLIALGLNATTNQGGGEKWLPQYTETLRLANVVLIPDNDDTGERHIRLVAPQLVDAGATVRVLRLPDLPPKGDVSDWLASGGTKEQLLALADSAPIYEKLMAPKTADPLPLCRESDEATEPPIDALACSPVAQNMTFALVEALQVPWELALNCVLAVANFAVLPHADVHIDGRVFPLALYLITIALSSERKTTADRIALMGFRAYYKRALIDFWKRWKAYERHLAAWKKNYDNIVKRDKGTSTSAVELLAEKIKNLGDPPIPPLRPRGVCEDPTWEGLFKLLAACEPGLGLFSNEAGTVVGGNGMTEENKLKMFAGLCNIWGGEPLDRIRSGDGNLRIEHPRATIHYQMQPGVFDRWASDSMLLEQGLGNRLSITRPVSRIGQRMYKEIDVSQHPAVIAFADRIEELFSVPLPMVDDVLTPPAIVLSAPAKQTWILFYNAIESELNGKYAPIRGFAAKSAEQALRIAGTLQLFDDINAKEIDISHLDAGMQLAEFYLAEALRVFSGPAASPELMEAQKVLDWLHLGGFTEVWIGDVYQKGPRCARTVKEARRLMRELEEHGHVRRILGCDREMFQVLSGVPVPPEVPPPHQVPTSTEFAR